MMSMIASSAKTMNAFQFNMLQIGVQIGIGLIISFASYIIGASLLAQKIFHLALLYNISISNLH